MMDLNVQLKTSKHLGRSDYAETFYDLISSWESPPTHFATFEPIRNAFTSNSKDAFVDAWLSQSGQYFGQVLLRRRGARSYYGSVQFIRGPRATFNSVSFYGVSSEFARENPLSSSLLSFIDRICLALPVGYGRVCTQASFTRKNIVLNYHNEDGSIQPRRPVGEDWTICLPGVYWCNYFGEPYVSWFGRDLLLSAPAFHVKELRKEMFRILAFERIEESDSPGANEAEQGIRDHLGRAAFFQKDDSSAILVAPEHDLSELRQD